MTVWTRDEGGEPRPMTDAELADYRATLRTEGFELITMGPGVDEANRRLVDKFGKDCLLQVSALLRPIDGSPGMSAVVQQTDGGDPDDSPRGPLGFIVSDSPPLTS